MFSGRRCLISSVADWENRKAEEWTILSWCQCQCFEAVKFPGQKRSRTSCVCVLTGILNVLTYVIAAINSPHQALFFFSLITQNSIFFNPLLYHWTSLMSLLHNHLLCHLRSFESFRTLSIVKWFIESNLWDSHPFSIKIEIVFAALWRKRRANIWITDDLNQIQINIIKNKQQAGMYTFPWCSVLPCSFISEGKPQMLIIFSQKLVSHLISDWTLMSTLQLWVSNWRTTLFLDSC